VEKKENGTYFFNHLIFSLFYCLLFKIFLFLLEIFIYSKDIWKFRVGKHVRVTDMDKSLMNIFSLIGLNIFIVAYSNMNGNNVGTLTHFVVYFFVI